MVQGRVQKVAANVGDAVTPGMELMQIEGVEVGEIKARFITARAQLKFTESTLERQKTLNEQRVGSRKTLLEAQADYDKARAAFDAEDKRIHSIGLRDADLLAFIDRGPDQGDEHTGGGLPLTSPIAGIIVERNVVIGQYVDAATTAFRIINTERLMADGQIYEKDIPRLAGKPPVAMHLPAFPDRSFAGTLVYISPVVDERTRTITVRALIPNKGGMLKPHMYGELRIPIGGGTQGILIPGEALHREGAVQYVFIATSDTTFERRTVESGETFDTSVHIRSGIAPGDRVVTRGSFQLKAESMRSVLEGDE
jgi:membrane fusion protein, heavy metal efflux system